MKKEHGVDRRELAEIPSFFAEQGVQVSVGPFVSKIVFGVEREESGPLIPNVSVTLPTPALVTLANQVFQLLGQKDVQSAMKADLDKHIETLAQITTAPA